MTPIRQLALPLVMVLTLGLAIGLSSLSVPAEARDLPEFNNQNPKQWFNSAPLKRVDLKGKVVLLDVWTYGCWNCYRSFPWLRSVENKFADTDFTVIGIHSPEFDHEKRPDNVANSIKKFKLHHPVMMDNDLSYWRALRNRYWPAYYLVDKQGQIRYTHIGETHAGDRNATQIEAEIQQLLDE